MKLKIIIFTFVIVAIAVSLTSMAYANSASYTGTMSEQSVPGEYAIVTYNASNHPTLQIESAAQKEVYLSLVLISGKTYQGTASLSVTVTDSNGNKSTAVTGNGYSLTEDSTKPVIRISNIPITLNSGKNTVDLVLTTAGYTVTGFTVSKVTIYDGIQEAS